MKLSAIAVTFLAAIMAAAVPTNDVQARVSASTRSSNPHHVSAMTNNLTGRWPSKYHVRDYVRRTRISSITA